MVVVTTNLTGEAFTGIYLGHSRLDSRTSSRKSQKLYPTNPRALADRGGPICPVRGRSRMCLVNGENLSSEMCRLAVGSLEPANVFVSSVKYFNLKIFSLAKEPPSS